MVHTPLAEPEARKDNGHRRCGTLVASLTFDGVAGGGRQTDQGSDELEFCHDQRQQHGGHLDVDGMRPFVADNHADAPFRS